MTMISHGIKEDFKEEEPEKVKGKEKDERKRKRKRWSTIFQTKK